MVTRPALAGAAGALATLLLTGTPAYADSPLPVSVAKIGASEVQLVAALPTGAGGRLPAVTVSRDGYALPAAVR
ncbi:hypothetical protein, partial [Asanoa sp. NPDC050611]|uniref:hypothetical protein n=1 Tax=Asanoa sp. NPDC050611 TaxID=3157098 RepID=UPI0033F16974